MLYHVEFFLVVLFCFMTPLIYSGGIMFLVCPSACAYVCTCVRMQSQPAAVDV